MSIPVEGFAMQARFSNVKLINFAALTTKLLNTTKAYAGR